MEAHIHMVVQGLVQGVGFRWYVARKAQSLGLKGFVKNLYDGSVEIEAEGNRSLIEELINDVRVGPRSAHVKGVRLEWSTPHNQHTGFEIL